jgi:hypothetical protein
MSQEISGRTSVYRGRQGKQEQGVAKMSCISHCAPGDILVMVPVGLDVPLGCSRQVLILHGALSSGAEAGTYVRVTFDLGVERVSPTGTLHSHSVQVDLREVSGRCILASCKRPISIVENTVKAEVKTPEHSVPAAAVGVPAGLALITRGSMYCNNCLMSCYESYDPAAVFEPFKLKYD